MTEADEGWKRTNFEDRGRRRTAKDGEEPRRMFMDVRKYEYIVCIKEKLIK
jgi:hypothetical protein